MAVLLIAGDEHGRGREITPRNGLTFELTELQEYVGGFIEILKTPNAAVVLVVDEEASFRGKEINKRASEFCAGNIIGDAVLCDISQIE